MPGWAQVLLGMAAVVTALSVLWTKAVRPGAKLISSTEEMLPLMRELTSVFKDNPSYFTVLNSIAEQFKTDSGSTLRDAVNRLEAASDVNATASESLKVGVETDRKLAERDREQMARILRQIDRQSVKIDSNIEALESIQVAAIKVASNLVAAQRAVDGVAADLSASHDRADAVHSSAPAGVAADAASTSAPAKEKRAPRKRA